MPAEHYRRRVDGKVILCQGYYCARCGFSGVNMIASGHGEGLCERNPVLVEELDRLNRGGSYLDAIKEVANEYDSKEEFLRQVMEDYQFTDGFDDAT